MRVDEKKIEEAEADGVSKGIVISLLVFIAACVLAFALNRTMAIYELEEFARGVCGSAGAAADSDSFSRMVNKYDCGRFR